MDANFRHERAADARACRRVRERLCGPVGAAAASRRTAGGAGAGRDGGIGAPGDAGGVAGHLASCADCAAFARRLELVRQALAPPLAEPPIELDPRFPARVLARVRRPAELIGWAAFRALPAALGLALALAGVGLLGLPAAATAPPSPLLDEPPSSDQLLTWSSLSPEVWP